MYGTEVRDPGEAMGLLYAFVYPMSTPISPCLAVVSRLSSCHPIDANGLPFFDQKIDPAHLDWVACEEDQEDRLCPFFADNTSFTGELVR